MSNSLVTTFIFFLACHVSVICQESSATCDEINKFAQELNDNYSKIKAQEAYQKADSLLRRATIAKCERALLVANHSLGRYFKGVGEFDKSKEALQNALSSAESLEDVGVQKDILSMYALVEDKMGRKEVALELLQTALDLKCVTPENDCIKKDVKLLINKSTFLQRLNREQESLKNLNFADSLMTANNSVDSMYYVVVNNVIGNIQSDLKLYDACLGAYKKALTYVPVGHKSRFALINNIANTYSNLEEIDSASVYYHHTINSTDELRYLIVPFQGLGDLSKKNGNIKKAREYYFKALKKAQGTGSVVNVAVGHGLIGVTYFDEENNLKAKEHFDESLLVFEKAELIDTKDALEVKKYSLINDLALKNGSTYSQRFENYLIENDSVLNATSQKELQLIINDYDKRKIKDSLSIITTENENRKLTIKNQRYLIATTVLTSILSFFLFGFLYKLYKKLMNVNEELIFEKRELIELNDSLKLKIAKKGPVISREAKDITLQLKSHDKTYKITVNDIYYVIAEDNGIRVFLSDKSIWSDLKLKAIIERLNGDIFVQIFRSTLVNIEKLEWVNHSSLRLIDGTELKIGRTFKKMLSEKISY